MLKIRITPPPVVRCLTAVETIAARLHFRVRWAASIAALVVCGTSTADFPVTLTQPVPRVVTVEIKPDPRAARLGKLFRRYHCPEPHHITEYLRAADGYGLDFRLLPAISIRETQCGVEEWEHNRWGYHPGRQTFPSVEVGINFVSWVLAEGPLYKGKSLHGKLFTYNPREAYPGEVKRIMDQAE